jgi:hypothetical protein
MKNMEISGFACFLKTVEAGAGGQECPNVPLSVRIFVEIEWLVVKG